MRPAPPGPPVVICPATDADVPACARILQDWLDVTPWMPNLHDLAETEGFVRGHLLPMTLLVAGGERIDGFLCLAEDGEIPALYVAAEARGRGIGAALIEAAKAEADQLRLWTFQANEGARRFYRGQGFVEGRATAGDNAERLPDVEMTWTRR